jgi:hypothetical protein
VNQKLPVHRLQSQDTIDEWKAHARHLDDTLLETFHKLANERKRVAELEARILMMATIENNLRGGLKQLGAERDRLKKQGLRLAQEILDSMPEAES